MDLNDFEVLGKLIEKEFNIRYLGLSRLYSYPMFYALQIPKFLKDNFEYELTGAVLMLVNIYHENLECLYPIIKRHENIENFNEKLKELEELEFEIFNEKLEELEELEELNLSI